MKMRLSLGLALILVLALTNTVFAVPRLQTYVVGGDEQAISGVNENAWLSSARSFDLKIVGSWGPATSGAPPAYDYMECFILMTVPQQEFGSIWINGVEISSFYRIPRYLRRKFNWLHNIPEQHDRFNLRHVGRIDNDQLGAYDYDHGDLGEPGWGDEISLDVVVEGFSSTSFGAFGIDSHLGVHFSTWSHEPAGAVPEPGTLSLLGVGLLGLVPLLRRR